MKSAKGHDSSVGRFDTTVAGAGMVMYILIERIRHRVSDGRRIAFGAHR